MLELLLIPYCIFFSRMCGGGFGAKYLPKAVPEALFCLPFGYVAYENLPYWPVALLVAALTFFAHNTGHGTALAMGDDPAVAQGGRKQFLSKVVDPICKLFKQPLGSLFYCLTLFAIKGLWIGFPFGLWALAFAATWPLSYYAGYKVGNKYGEVELFSGLCAGVILYLAL